MHHQFGTDLRVAGRHHRESALIHRDRFAVAMFAIKELALSLKTEGTFPGRADELPGPLALVRGLAGLPQGIERVGQILADQGLEPGIDVSFTILENRPIRAFGFAIAPGYLTVQRQLESGQDFYWPENRCVGNPTKNSPLTIAIAPGEPERHIWHEDKPEPQYRLGAQTEKDPETAQASEPRARWRRSRARRRQRTGAIRAMGTSDFWYTRDSSPQRTSHTTQESMPPFHRDEAIFTR